MSSDNRLIGSKNIEWARKLYAENELHKQLLEELITFIGSSAWDDVDFINQLIRMADYINDLEESPVEYEWLKDEKKQMELKDYE